MSAKDVRPATDLSDFRNAFFEEAAEHVASVEAGLLRLETGTIDAEGMNAIFRAVHSVKGLAATLGFTDIATFTHDFESVLDRLRNGTLEVTSSLTQVLFRANDTLRELLDANRSGQGTPLNVSDVRAALGAALTGAPVAVASAVQARWWSVRFLPKSGMFLRGQDPMLVVRELSEMGSEVSVVCDASKLPSLASLDVSECHLVWVVKFRSSASREEVAGAFLFVEDDCEYSIRDVTDDPARAGVAANAPAIKAPVAGEPRAVAAESASIRVPTEKIDALVDLVGEMVIAQAMVNEIAAVFDISKLQTLRDALSSLDRNTRDLQEHIMSVRMLPVATVFNRFPRLVRDVATTLGKKVRLEMVGSETELDKGMIERIGDPLTHLVRNAVDHGLELPAERSAAGKSDTGAVTLRAFHEGGNVIIEIEDDGRGLHTARIREKAVERGLIRAEDVLSDEAIHQLIFAPGFSTASTVSDLSGRGVGMDVVKRNVEGMSGSVSLHSVPGTGSRVRIRLPLTLAILDGLVVAVGNESYVIPLLSVVESLRPKPGQVHEILGGGEVLVMRGESVPFVRLHEAFALSDAVTEPSLGIVVIAETDGHRFGLLVDDVVGQQQVVIKNLEANYRRINAIMGATILGDGRVSLIVDTQELSRMTRRGQPLAAAGVSAGSEDES